MYNLHSTYMMNIECFFRLTKHAKYHFPPQRKGVTYVYKSKPFRIAMIGLKYIYSFYRILQTYHLSRLRNSNRIIVYSYLNAGYENHRYRINTFVENFSHLESELNFIPGQCRISNVLYKTRNSVIETNKIAKSKVDQMVCLISCKRIGQLCHMYTGCAERSISMKWNVTKKILKLNTHIEMGLVRKNPRKNHEITKFQKKKKCLTQHVRQVII